MQMLLKCLFAVRNTEWEDKKIKVLGLAHTMDKFENTALRGKTEQMFCIHTREF